MNNAIGFGPISPTVKLGLALRFNHRAVGRTYSVEVAAPDDLGNADPYGVAGTLTVK